MEEEDQDKSPFWLQSSSSSFSRGRRRRRRSSGGIEIVVVAAIAAAFVFFVVPSLFSSATQALRPHFIRRSWDSLNFVLVLFAIICGFLSRGSEEATGEEDRRVPRSNPVTPRQWYGGSDRVVVGYGGSRMRRNSSSYPDLRMQDEPWVAGDEPWRFYDDTRLYDYRFRGSDQIYQWYRPQPEQPKDRPGGDFDGFKDIEVDESQKQTAPCGLASPSAPSSPPRVRPPPPSSPLPPATKVVKRKEKRVYQDISSKGEIHKKSESAGTISRSSPPSSAPPKMGKTKGKRMINQSVVPPSEKSDIAGYSEAKIYPAPLIQPPPPPPPPPPPLYYHAGKKNDKKRGGATKDFLIALRRKKKKKQRQKSIDSLDILFNQEPLESSSLPPATPPRPPPPPPPPPPPKAFFQNLFPSKKGKSKKSRPAPPPPPPPPPPQRSSLTLQSRAAKVTSQNPSVTSQEPNPPAKLTRSSTPVNETSIRATGNESPLIRIPPPPPPPPFKMPPWKFVVQGDYVRLLSNTSSRSESSDLDDEEADIPGSGEGGESPAPSSDVDTKADKFIERFRAGLRLEKMNSVKERQGRSKSNLGPAPGP